MRGKQVTRGEIFSVGDALVPIGRMRPVWEGVEKEFVG